MPIILCETCKNYKLHQEVKVPMAHSDWVPCREQWWDCQLKIKEVVDLTCASYEKMDGEQEAYSC